MVHRSLTSVRARFYNLGKVIGGWEWLLGAIWELGREIIGSNYFPGRGGFFQGQGKLLNFWENPKFGLLEGWPGGFGLTG